MHLPPIKPPAARRRGDTTFDDDLRVVVSIKLKKEPMDAYQREMVEKVEGKSCGCRCGSSQIWRR